MDILFYYGFPAGALFIGAVSVLLSLRASRAFDKEFGKSVILQPVPRETAMKATASRVR